MAVLLLTVVAQQCHVLFVTRGGRRGGVVAVVRGQDQAHAQRRQRPLAVGWLAHVHEAVGVVGVARRRRRGRGVVQQNVFHFRVTTRKKNFFSRTRNE